MPVVLDDDSESAADRLRPLFASFTDAPGRNFHSQAFGRMGLEDVADRVGALWRTGQQREAAAAIPTWLIEQLALVGPPAKIPAQLPAWRESPLTTLLVHVPPRLPALRTVAEIVLG